MRSAVESIETDLSTNYYNKTDADSKMDEKIASAISSVYKPSGSIAFESLPVLSATEEGKVYNITNEFTTTDDFVEGAGKKYPVGTNVVCIEVEGPSYKWDVLAGVVDLSAYETADSTEAKIATLLSMECTLFLRKGKCSVPKTEINPTRICTE